MKVLVTNIKWGLDEEKLVEVGVPVERAREYNNSAPNLPTEMEVDISIIAYLELIETELDDYGFEEDEESVCDMGLREYIEECIYDELDTYFTFSHYDYEIIED